MTWILTAYRLTRRAASLIAEAARTALDLARRLLIYACLAAVVVADWILDRIDPGDHNASRP